MKRNSFLLLLVCIIWALTACGGTDNAPKGSLSEEENPFAQCVDGDTVTDLTDREWIVSRDNPEYYLTSAGTIVGTDNAPGDNSGYFIGVRTKEELPEEEETEEPSKAEDNRPAPGEIVYDNEGTPWVVSESGEFCFVDGVVCSDPTDEEG